MITTLVGKTFLEAFNEKFDRQYTAKEFFENEYFELFFNHPKYMQWITNSPFVQMKAEQKPEKLSAGERKEKLLSLYEKVENDVPDASFAVGFPASESKEYASTSGLVSDILIRTDEEDIYYSWIGSGLGIGVAGGYNILINDASIALETFEGWKIYRKYLNEPVLSKLRGNQINSWNGQWLAYKLGRRFTNDFDFATLESEEIFTANDGAIEVNTVNWSNLFFSLSNVFPEKVLNAYVYSFGRTNKTLGFVPIYLKAGKTLKDVFKKLFLTDMSFNNKDLQSMFGMHIKRACELGNIGLHALRPENLRKYMEEGKNLSFKKDEDTLIYQSYKTWLIAMLSKNKEEITEYTLELARIIQRYRAGANKSTERKNLIENQLLGTRSKRTFIEALATVIEEIDESDLEQLKQLRDDVHLMTNEEFGYFVTLLKFDYAFIERQS